MTTRSTQDNYTFDSDQKTRLRVYILFILAGTMFFIGNSQAGILGTPAPTEQSIDCSWQGGYVNCTINEPQGIGSVLLYRELNGEPWFSLLGPYPDCPKTKSFGAHADGPSSLLIDVKPCKNSLKFSTYRYIPIDTNSPTGQLKVLKVPNEKNLGQSIEGLMEENKRLWKFLEFQKKERGVVRED